MEKPVVNIDQDDPSDAEDGLGKACHRQEEGNLVEYENDQSLRFKQYWNSEGEEELSEVEADLIFDSEKLAMERDEGPEDQNEESDEDSSIDSDSEHEGGDYDSNYIPNEI